MKLLLLITAAIFTSLMMNFNGPRLKGQRAAPDTFDTVIRPFADKSYKLKLHIISEDSTRNRDKNNSVINFTHSINGKTSVVFQDSIYCMTPWIYSKDFDGDGVKDILIFHIDGARANARFYLYLVKPLLKKLVYVKGFEELPNADFDRKNKVITSMGLFGQSQWFKFYRINGKYRLVNLGHSFISKTDEEDNKYETAMKSIRRKKY